MMGAKAATGLVSLILPSAIHSWVACAFMACTFAARAASESRTSMSEEVTQAISFGCGMRHPAVVGAVITATPSSNRRRSVTAHRMGVTRLRCSTALWVISWALMWSGCPYPPSGP